MGQCWPYNSNRSNFNSFEFQFQVLIIISKRGNNECESSLVEMVRSWRDFTNVINKIVGWFRQQNIVWGNFKDLQSEVTLHSIFPLWGGKDNFREKSHHQSLDLMLEISGSEEGQQTEHHIRDFASPNVTSCVSVNLCWVYVAEIERERVCVQADSISSAGVGLRRLL